MTCEELRPLVTGIASLPEGDLEREAFLAHARSCPGCMEELRKSERLLRLIESAPLPAPSSSALLRASAPIVAELRPRRAWPLRAGAALLGFALLLLVPRHREPESWTPALLVAALVEALEVSASVRSTSLGR